MPPEQQLIIVSHIVFPVVPIQFLSVPSRMGKMVPQFRESPLVTEALARWHLRECYDLGILICLDLPFSGALNILLYYSLSHCKIIKHTGS